MALWPTRASFWFSRSFAKQQQQQQPHNNNNDNCNCNDDSIHHSLNHNHHSPSSHLHVLDNDSETSQTRRRRRRQDASRHSNNNNNTTNNTTTTLLLPSLSDKDHHHNHTMTPTDPQDDLTSHSHTSDNMTNNKKPHMKTFLNQPSLDIEFGITSSPPSGCSGSTTSSQRRALPKVVEQQQQAEPLLPTSTNKTTHKVASVQEIWAVGVYSFCSVSMILTNKSLASSYNQMIEKPIVGQSQKADLNTLLVIFQAAAAVVFCWGCKSAKLIDYPVLQWSIVRAWAPVNIFFCLMLFTSIAALQTNSVPMVTVFKNISTIMTATADYFLFANQLEPLSIAAFVVMLLGAVFSAWNDMETSWVGLFWMLFNCVASTGYVCYMRHATQSLKMTKFGMVYVNNVLCVLFLIPVAFMNGEWALFMRSTGLHTLDYGFKNFFAGFVGFFLNFASLNCVSVAGATTYAIVGSLNKVPVTFLGYLLFDTSLTPETWFFVCVSLLGGFLYTWSKLRAKSAERKAAAEAMSDSNK